MADKAFKNILEANDFASEKKQEGYKNVQIYSDEINRIYNVRYTTKR